MTLEEIFAAASELQLHVHNLFQRDDGQWQANVREAAASVAEKDGTGTPIVRNYCHQFAVAAGPVDAMIEAINLAVARRDK